MKSHYFTVSGNGESLFKEKGSKFIGCAFGVSSPDEIEQRLMDVRKIYHDARHHCYAWVLGQDQESYRANDDGEPGHSAGDPILGQIRSKGLTNCLVVVVRYFGGTKLGVSSLIQAYRAAADEALMHAGKKKIAIEKTIEIAYPYESTSTIMRMVDQYNISIVNQQFDASCLLVGKIGVAELEFFESELDLLEKTGSKINCKLID